jgi:hypothetical protein
MPGGEALHDLAVLGPVDSGQGVAEPSAHSENPTKNHRSHLFVQVSDLKK